MLETKPLSTDGLIRQNLCGTETGSWTDTMPKYRTRLSSHVSCSVKVARLKGLQDSQRYASTLLEPKTDQVSKGWPGQHLPASEIRPLPLRRRLAKVGPSYVPMHLGPWSLLPPCNWVGPMVIREYTKVPELNDALGACSCLGKQ